MRISIPLFSLLFFLPPLLCGQQSYQLDFQSYSIDPPISFDTIGKGEIILAHQIFDNNIQKESTALTYLTAQADTFWTKSFPDFRSEEILKDPTGFILAGNGLVKVDVQGIVSWAFSYGKNIHALCLDGQNGYLIAGSNFLARVDTNGSLIWAKDLPLFIDKIIPNKSSNFAAAGSSNFGQGFPTLLSFDLQGTIRFAYAYIDGSQQALGGAADLLQGIDSSFYLAANISSTSFVNEPALIKTDINGNLKWLAKGGLVSGNDKLLYSLSQDSQQNLYLGGRGGTLMGGLNGRIPFLAKIDSSGNPLVAKDILYAGSAKQLKLKDNKLWVAGSYDIEFSGKEYLALFDTSLSYCSFTNNLALTGFRKSNSVSRANLNLNPSNLTLNASPLSFSSNLSIPFLKACFGCGDSAKAAFSYDINGNSVSFEDTSSAALEWFWDFGDGNSTNQRNPSHTYANAGTYEVCLSVGNACGTATFCDSVSLWRTSRLSERENFHVLLSPNPAKDILSVHIEAATFDIHEIRLRSIDGKLLKTYAIGSQNETKLNINEFPGGIYLLEIQSSTGNKHVQKFIIDVAK